MSKSATDVMHDIIVSAVIDSVMALKAASKGLPNTLLRELNAVHANTTFADLPNELQAAISASVRSAFNRLLKEGYSVSGDKADSVRRAPSPPGDPARARHQKKPPTRPVPTETKRPPRNRDRPGRKPDPRGT